MAARIDREELRQLIREALREALGAPSPEGSPPPLRGRVGEGGKPQAQASRTSPAPNPSPHGGGGRTASATYRFGSGVLTEAKIADIGRTHSKILVGGGAVLTPLARDKAREMKLEIVRQGP